MIKYLIPLLSILFNILIKYRKNKIEFIYLFSSKFGHFYLNTEVYLRENINNKNIKYYFIGDRGKVDNEELKNIWEKIIVINSWELGIFFLFFSKLYKNILVTRVHNYTFPKNLNLFLNNRVFKDIFVQSDKILVDFYNSTNTKEYICFSIRDSQYNYINQNYALQSWRNSHICSYELLVRYLINQGFGVILVNRNVSGFLNFNDNRYYDYSKSGNYSLQKELTFVFNCKLYIGSSTGLDVFPLTNSVDTLITNITLGVSFQTIVFTKLTIVIPQKLYSTTEDRYVTLTEYLAYLKEVEDKYKIDRFELFEQSMYGVLPIPPSEDELLEGTKEALMLLNNEKFMDEIDEINQRKFWSIYPEIYDTNGNKTGRVAHKTPHLAIISPYFLRKNKYFLE